MNHSSSLPDLKAELVELKVDLIVTNVTQASLAAKGATRTIPIVMQGVSDPIGTGLVASLARPGANVTGTSAMSGEVVGKSLEALRELGYVASMQYTLRMHWILCAPILPRVTPENNRADGSAVLREGSPAVIVR